MAASPLPSRGPTRGRKCYQTLAFSGVPNKADIIGRGCLTPAFSGAKRRAEVLPNPCVLGGPQHKGQNQKWLPHRFFSRAHKRAQVQRNPCLLGGPQQTGQNRKWLPHPCNPGGPSTAERLRMCSWGSPNKRTKSEVVASPLPSHGPKRGWKCYVTPAFLGVPNKGDKMRSGGLTPAFSGAHNRAEVLCNPCILGCPQEG